MNQPFLLVFLNSSYVQNIPFSCLYLCQQPAVFYMFNSWTDNLSLTNLRFKRKVKHLDDGPDQGFRLSSCDYTCFFPPLFFFSLIKKKKKNNLLPFLFLAACINHCCHSKKTGKHPLLFCNIPNTQPEHVAAAGVLMLNLKNETFTIFTVKNFKDSLF